MLNRSRCSRSDSGFTLIELLLAIAILGVITLPIGNLIISYFKNTTQTTARLAESHDAQIAAAYFAQDVASLGIRSTTFNTPSQPYVLQLSVNNPAYPCTQAGVTPIISFVWDQFDSTGTGTQIRVSYGTFIVGTEKRLIRVHCTASATPDATAVLAHNVDTSVAPAASCTGPTGPSCTMTLSIRDPHDTSALAVTLNGQRRQT